MVDPKSHPSHINNVLGKMIQSWIICNPEALRAIHKVNQKNQDFLFMPADLKLKFIRDMKVANFKDSSGNNIDLLSIEREAHQQKALLLANTAKSETLSGKKATQKALRDTHGRIYAQDIEVSDTPLGIIL